MRKQHAFGEPSEPEVNSTTAGSSASHVFAHALGTPNFTRSIVAMALVF